MVSKKTGVCPKFDPFPSHFHAKFVLIIAKASLQRQCFCLVLLFFFVLL